MALSETVLLIGKIGAIFENERTTIAGVGDEVEKIKLELLCMKAFLEDEEVNRNMQTEVEKTWVASIRDLAYDVEDIIDEFMYHMYEKKNKVRLSRMVFRCVHTPSNLWFSRKTAKKLQKITEEIKDTAKRNTDYVNYKGRPSTSENIPDWMQSQVESSFFIREDELVGIEDNKQVLMGWLMDTDENQTIVSVVGMGGSGKTTLVAKTFTNEKVKRHFHCYAWITVSQTYVVVDLFRRLIMELYKSRKEDLPSNLNAKSRMELLEILICYMETKRYLVVLDDVWNINVWREIMVSLQDRQLGSRVIITTRKEDVACNSFGVKSYVHHIQPLQKDEAWELFSKKAFSNNQHKTCPNELESLAHQLVEKCDGLPLAIVALGGLMSSKKSVIQWEKVRSSFNWHLHKNSVLDPVKNILLLSFNDLPSQLKQCFLFCSLFPEDFVFKRKRLVRLWIAEGFVEYVKGLTPEGVADEYLMELCFRNMLQVVDKNVAGRPKTVKMHDLMRELGLSISEEEKFGSVYDGREVMEEISTRRLSIHTSSGGGIKSCTGMSKIRSLLVFSTDMSRMSSMTFSNTLVSRVKLLRTLDLEDVQIDKLPQAVVYLFNLRYLNLKGTLIKTLPESIGRLRNLQFLNISGSKIESLPVGITKLLNLRHLNMYCYFGGFENFNSWRGTRVPSNICKLQNLQSLLCIVAEGDVIRRLGKLSQLTSLGITNLKERDGNDLWDSVKKLTVLQSLDILSSNEEEILPVNAESPPLPHLQKLYLYGRLRNVTPWFSSLRSLTGLFLNWTRLEDDLLPHIEELPNLTTLHLCNAYVGEDLCFRRGFVKLVRLQLLNFASLENIAIEEGVMPNLQYLWIDGCMELKTMPLGLEYLSSLQTLILESVPIEIINPIRKGGADRSNVQHIQEIRHYYQQSSGQWVSENLA